MLDLSQTIGFDWDEANSGKSASKHSVSRAEAEQIFFDEQLLLADDVKHSQDELRFHALGQTIEGRVLHVTFTLRDNQTGIRVISARDASRRESAAYAQKA